MPSQQNISDSFQFRRSAFYQRVEEQCRLAAAKAAELRINLDIEGYGIPNARFLSHSPSFPPPSFTQSRFPPRSLVRDGH
jgi:hypothetical protein